MWMPNFIFNSGEQHWIFYYYSSSWKHWHFCEFRATKIRVSYPPLVSVCSASLEKQEKLCRRWCGLGLRRNQSGDTSEKLHGGSAAVTDPSALVVIDLGSTKWDTYFCSPSRCSKPVFLHQLLISGRGGRTYREFVGQLDSVQSAAFQTFVLLKGGQEFPLGRLSSQSQTGMVMKSLKWKKQEHKISFFKFWPPWC